jgi:hypothetical protein
VTPQTVVEGIVLDGDGVSDDVVQDFTLRHSRESRLSHGRIVLLADVDSQRLERALKPPFDACFEVVQPTEPLAPRLLGWLRESGLAASVTTATAFRQDLAHHFSVGLAERLDLADGVRATVESALHEAISNGIVHGNMEIEGGRSDIVADLDAFNQLAGERLEDPAFAARRIHVLARWRSDEIEVTVADEGAGYDVGSAVETVALGRGLSIIADLASEITLTDRGRAITMMFTR